jgi:hypothetical protein
LPLVLAEAPNITSTVCWFNSLERNVLSNLCFCSVSYARRSPLSAVLLLLLLLLQELPSFMVAWCRARMLSPPSCRPSCPWPSSLLCGALSGVQATAPHALLQEAYA